MNLHVTTGKLPSKGLPQTPDPQLLYACRTGDEHAWQQLLEKYERLVYSVPIQYGLSNDDAADITQIVFTALIQSLDTLRDDSNLGDWLALVARRHTSRMFRCYPHANGDALTGENQSSFYSNRTTKGAYAQAALPPALHNMLLQRFVDYVHFRQQSGLFQRQRAILTFDGHQPLPSGLRGSEDEATRQYVYASEVADVMLTIQPCWCGMHFDLIGQILPYTPSLVTNSFIAQLLHHQQEVAIALTDPVGGFWFHALNPNSYQLMLRVNNLEIEIPNFIIDP